MARDCPISITIIISIRHVKRESPSHEGGKNNIIMNDTYEENRKRD